MNIIRLLLEAKADVDSRSRTGLTPLMMAAGIGDMEVTDLLLQGGAETSLRSDDGLTAADIARREGHIDLVAKIDKFR